MASFSTTASNTAQRRTPRSWRRRWNESAGAPAASRARSPPTRCYGEPAVERDLQALGVRTVAIRNAKTSPERKAAEHQRSFRRLVKWRTGSEGGISYLKRGYGWDRTRLDGRQRASIWCGHGVFAHNLVKIGALASQLARRPRHPRHRPSPKLRAKAFRSK